MNKSKILKNDKSAFVMDNLSTIIIRDNSVMLKMNNGLTEEVFSGDIHKCKKLVDSILFWLTHVDLPIMTVEKLLDNDNGDTIKTSGKLYKDYLFINETEYTRNEQKKSEDKKIECEKTEQKTTENTHKTVVSISEDRNSVTVESLPIGATAWFKEGVFNMSNVNTDDVSIANVPLGTKSWFDGETLQIVGI